MKRIILSLIILAMLLTSTSCQNTPAAKESDTDLSIYITDYDMAIKEAIQKFNTTHEKGKINAKNFFSDQIEDYQNQLLSELSTGNGPDIIVFHSYQVRKLSKYLNLDAFCDINELMAGDSEFKLEDYNQSVLNCGVMDGKRYFIPISYTLEALFSTEEALASNNLTIGQKPLSQKDLAELAKSYSNPNGGKLLNYFSYTSDMNHFINSFKGTASLGTEEFKSFMDQFRVLTQNSTEGADPAKASAMLKNGEVALLNSSIYSMNSLFEPYSSFETAVNPVLIPLASSYEGNKISASPALYVGINKNCSNKKNAYAFIKTLLSTEEQIKNYNYGLPVNLEAYEKIKEQSYKSISSNTGGIRDEATLTRLLTKLDEIVGSNLDCRMTDYEAAGIVAEGLMSFVAGDKAPETICKETQDKLDSYFKDNSVIEAQATQTAAPQNASKLTIHYMDYTWSIKNAIRAFNDSHTDIQIEGTTYANTAIEDYITKLTTSVMAGEGPDIMVYAPTMFNSLNKTMSTGVFSDLNELISKDQSFDPSAFFPEVFNSGVTNGKRYFIPISFDLPKIVAAKSSLDKLGITLNESGWTLDDLKGAINKYQATNPSSNQYFFDSSMSFRQLLRACGIQLIDYQTNTTRFGSKEFIDLLTFYKELNPLVMPPEVEMNLDFTPTLLKNQTIMMSVLRAQSPEQLWMTNSIFSAELKDDFTIYPFPTLTSGSKFPIQIYDVASINSKCANQQGAFDFVKLLLSEEIQRSKDSHGNSNLTFGLPININAYEKDLEEMKKPVPTGSTIGFGNGIKTMQITPIPLTDALINKVKKINNQMGPVNYMDKEVENIINEGLQSFLDGKRTAEQAAKDIDEKVTLFLNE